MNVGLLDSPAARLGPYWAAYLRALDVPLASPALDDAEALEVGRASLPGESVVVQLALGRLLALGRVDTALISQHSAVTGDAWGAAFTEVLPRRISGLPTLIALPDHPDPLEHLESVAAEVGLRVSHRAGEVRRALDKVRPLARGPKQDWPLLGRAGRATVGVIGPRSLLAEPLLSGGLRPALEALGLHPVFSHELPLADVLRRAERMENAAKVPPGERELFGALSLLAGRGAVRGFVFAAPARDGATGAALTRLERHLRKPALHLSVDAGQSEFAGLEAFRDLVTLGQAEAAESQEEHA